QIGNVIVSLRYQQRHVVRGTKPSRILVCGERLAEFVQADVADGEITEDDRESFSVFAALELAIGALIVLKGFSKAVLAVKDVSKIDVEARKTPGVICLRKDLPRPIGRGECAIVLAEQTKRHKRSAECFAYFLCVLLRFKKRESLIIKVDGYGVITTGVRGITAGTKAVGQSVRLDR